MDEPHAVGSSTQSPGRRCVLILPRSPQVSPFLKMSFETCTQFLTRATLCVARPPHTFGSGAANEQTRSCITLIFYEE